MATSLTTGFTGLNISTIIGVLPHERRHKQRLKLTLQAGLSDVPSRDDLAQVVDYRWLANRSRQFLVAGAFGTLEYAIKSLADTLLAEEPRLSSLCLVVQKRRVLPGRAIAECHLQARR